MATSYDAFISYSHAAAGKLALALQNALHRFAKPWYKRCALHLFRDQTSLAASPGLWPSIEAALQSHPKCYVGDHPNRPAWQHQKNARWHGINQSTDGNSLKWVLFDCLI